MSATPLSLGAMRPDWIADAMSASAAVNGYFLAKTPEGAAFATVRLVDQPGKNFGTAAFFLGLPVWVLFICSFAYPIGFVGVAFLSFNVWSVSRRLARIEVDGGSWWYANRSTIWQLMKEELLLLVYQALAMATLVTIILGAGFTVAYGIQLYRIQRRVGETHLSDWMQNAVLGLVRDYPASAGRGVTATVEIPPIPTVTSEQLADMQARMRADFDRLATLSTFDTARPELIKAWKDSNTRYLEHLLQEGDKLTRAAWDDAIGIFNAAKDNVDVARGGLRQSVTAAETALAAYTIDEASIVVERSGTLEGAMTAARLAPKTFTQTLNYSRGNAMMATKAITGNVPWQVAIGAAVLSLIMMGVNHSKLMRHLKELEGQLVGQAEAVRGDITLIESELRLRLIPQFDGLAGLLNRIKDGIAELNAAEAQVGRGNAKAEAFHLACAVREANYLLEMKAGN